MPSIGQYYQWLKVCCTSITGSETVNYRTNTDNIDYFYKKDKSYTNSNTPADFNYPTTWYTYDVYNTTSKYLLYQITNYHNTKGLSSYFSALATSFWAWTSTENYPNIVFILNFDSNMLYMDGRQQYGMKDGSGKQAVIWPVLAF